MEIASYHGEEMRRNFSLADKAHDERKFWDIRKYKEEVSAVPPIDRTTTLQ